MNEQTNKELIVYGLSLKYQVKSHSQLNNDITLCIALSWVKPTEYGLWLWLLSLPNNVDIKSVWKEKERAYENEVHSTWYKYARLGKVTIKNDFEHD